MCIILHLKLLNWTCYFSLRHSICQGAQGTAPVVPLGLTGAAPLRLYKHRSSLPGSHFTSPKCWHRGAATASGSPCSRAASSPFTAGRFASPAARREQASMAAFLPDTCLFLLPFSVLQSLRSRPIMFFPGTALFVPTEYPHLFASCLVFRLKVLNINQI